MSEYIDFIQHPDGIGELIFDRADVKVNVLNTSVMQELDNILTKIKELSGIKVLIIKSAKKDIFIAGADLNEIKSIQSFDDALKKSQLGQDIINKLEVLPFPTVAVINGACLGGGLELALACSFRIVTDKAETQLGLPETSLGIMPGFGGSYRLPKLVGLSQGLNMILTGKSVDGVKALKIKLADACFPEAFLKEKTADFIRQILNPQQNRIIQKKRGKKKLSIRFLEKTILGKTLIFKTARKTLLKKTHGAYPAPISALNVIRKTYKKQLHRALELESKAFAKLAVSSIAKHLIEIYFINEELKKAYSLPKKSSNGDTHQTIRLAAVLGAGKMGGGIAWLLSNANITVRMKDINWKSINTGFKSVSEIYDQLKKLKKLDNREAGLKIHRITGTIDYSGFKNMDLVIEAIFEDQSAKIQLFKELEDIIPETALIATNTSSLSVTELAEKLRYPERFVGFHFFNPVNRMPLIEIVKGSQTSELTVQRMIQFARILKKTPILVKDCHGFLVNRILIAYLNEAVLMLDEGTDFTKIDQQMERFGMPMGPFALLDEIGIKVGYKIAGNLEHHKPEKIVNSKIFDLIAKQNNLIGKSSGQGFYLYKKGKKIPNPSVIDLIRHHQEKITRPLTEKEITDRCVLRLLNEAALSLEEGIVDKAEYLDMALILGIGFPPFRGGILRYADEIGFEECVNHLKEYEARYGKRFTVTQLLIDMAYHKRRFYP